MAKAVKKVVKVVAPIAIGFIAGPALAGVLGVTSAAGTAAVSGALGGFTSGLVQGGGLEGALKGAALGGLGGYALGSFGGAGAASGGGAIAGGAPELGLSALTAASSAPIGSLTLPATATGFGAGAGAAAYGGAFGAPTIGTLAGSTAGSFGSTPELAAPIDNMNAGQGFSLSQPSAPLATSTTASPQGSGFLQTLQQKTGMGTGDLIKGGINIAKNLYQSSEQQQLAEAIAQRADPFQDQRGAAVGAGLQALTDPTKHPLYQQSVAEAEKALARKQAAAGGYYSGRALEQAAQLPAEVAAALQRQQLTGASQVAQSAGGAPGTAATQYGNLATSSAANKADIFNVVNETLKNIYGN